MVLSAMLALSLSAAPASEDVVAATRAWEERRLKRLQAEDGWLTLVGLGWLQEGANSAGSDGKAAVVFPGGAPKNVGTFTRSGAKVTFEPTAGVTVTRDGKPFVRGPVQTDEEGRAKPDILQVNGLRFQLIVRGDRIGVRIKDPEARARKEFKGIPMYPVAERWRIVARWEPANPPVEIAVPNVLGEVERSPSPGTAVFTFDGKEYRLTPVLEVGSPDLFFVFADETNRTETYGAGRFLYADPAKDGTVILDFNRAYNPPCAFSAFATCPLPPKQNRLALRVEAGEKRPASH
ncbi:MAG TPA: DUF1684 domain-containing protein [Myxococcaceae bacterium]|nr:DUF1684 domain-containing protein [Myxococcaceae bacterium]